MIKKHKDTIRVIVVDNNLDKKSRLQNACMIISYMLTMWLLAFGYFDFNIAKIVISFIIMTFCFGIQYFVVANMKEYYGKEL